MVIVRLVDDDTTVINMGDSLYRHHIATLRVGHMKP